MTIPITAKTEFFSDNTGYVYLGVEPDKNWNTGFAMNKTGCFVEARGKYKIAGQGNDYDIKFDTRTRLHINNLWNSEDINLNIKERLALNATQKLPKGFSVYEIAGTTVEIPLDKKCDVKVKPAAILGLNKAFDIGKNSTCNIYIEGYPIDRMACLGVSIKF